MQLSLLPSGRRGRRGRRAGRSPASARSPPPPRYAATSKVSVVHGIPDTPVDVYVNGKKTLDELQARRPSPAR